jgi:hypothetical protein
MLYERKQPEKATTYCTVTFWKKQSCGDRKQTKSCQGLEAERGADFMREFWGVMEMLDVLIVVMVT